MEKPKKVHLYFEQSGTFKRAFNEFGILAEDYDILNEFGETDYQVNLFREITRAYEGKPSILDEVKTRDLIIAFFPCTYFSQNNVTFFNGTNINWKGKPRKYVIEEIIKRSENRQYFYAVALMLFGYCETKGLRLIVENPWSQFHYFYNNFPYRPLLVDKNRRLRGDYFCKPTQYYFINCKPTMGQSFQRPMKKLSVNNLSGHQGSHCDRERSMISPEYARNFIRDFILGPEYNIEQSGIFK